MREAAAVYNELQGFIWRMGTWETGPDACEAECSRITAYFEKVQKRMDQLMTSFDADKKRFKKEGIPWDDRVVKDVKASSLHLTELFLDRVLHEVERIKGAPNQEGRIYTLLVSGVRFAFRCHQFAGGMNEPSLAKFEEVSQLMAIYRPADAKQ